MSDAKKDDHGGGHDKPKSTLGAKLVGAGIAVLMLLLFVYYLGATVPEVVRGGAALVGDTGNATTLLGRGFTSMSNGIRNLNIGFNGMLIEILIMLAKAAIVVWLIMLLVGMFRKKKDDHPAGAAH